MDKWQELKERLIDYVSYNKMGYDDAIGLYGDIIKDLERDIKSMEKLR